MSIHRLTPGWSATRKLSRNGLVGSHKHKPEGVCRPSSIRHSNGRSGPRLRDSVFLSATGHSTIPQIVKTGNELGEA